MDIVSKINGNTLSATEFNQIPTELETVQTSSGQTSSDAILDQVSIGIARYAACNFYTDSGSANAYVLSPKGSFKSPVSATVGYYDGMYIRFRAGNANTGASTVNVNGAGVKDLKRVDGTTALSAGDIPTTQDSIFRYNGTAFALEVGSASTTAKGIVELLTNAELAAGTDTTRAATAAAIAALFGNSVRGTSGYARIPIKVSGAFVEFILQWNTITVGSSPLAFNLPITFPNAGLVGFYSPGSTGANSYGGVVNVSTTQVNVWVQNPGASGQYLVIGY